MNKMFIIILFFYSICLNAQDGFQYLHSREKIKIPFELSNNLIVVPITINHLKLNFLLDTGVDDTIIFSITENQELFLNNTETVKLKGLGSKDYINGLISKENRVELHKKLIDSNHKIIIVLDDLFNISSSLGITINGILGSKFFRNHLIEIDYLSKNIYVFKNNILPKKVEKQYTSFDLEIIKGKPYLNNISINNNLFNKKILIDIGNTDALWLFSKTDERLKIPIKNYFDFLGRGFSGEIYGKRGKTESFEFKNFKFNSIFAAYPDSTSVNNVDLITDRIGSVGGEIMRRFSVFFDYQNQKMYLKKNKNYKNPILYNLSGLEIQHFGMQWIKEENSPLKSNTSKAITEFSRELQFKFTLKPNYIIANVRENSNAAKIGVKKDDILVTINGKRPYNLTLDKINAILRSEIGEKIELIVERNGKEMKFEFILEDILK